MWERFGALSAMVIANEFAWCVVSRSTWSGSVCSNMDGEPDVTPLAARIFRLGDEATQRALAGSQFLECTALTSMALEMRRADTLATGFSANARLPAPHTFIEALMKGRRVGFGCHERETDGRVSVNCITQHQDGRIASAWRAAFVPGSDQITFDGDTIPPEAKVDSIVVGLFLVEKFLCIVNQAGLVELRPRDTDKRVVRLAAARRMETPQPKWHECHIKPGVHGVGAAAARAEHREHQLHYVRKHLKPSLGPDRWIDGYWRGNADLGIHLKTYVGHAPKEIDAGHGGGELFPED